MAYLQSPLDQPGVYPFVRRNARLYESPTGLENEYNENSKSGAMLALADDVAYIAAFALIGVMQRRFNKIVGSRPGPMKFVAEESIASDFRAGHSWYPREIKSLRVLFDKYFRNIGKIGRGGLIAAALSGSLVFGNISYAENVVPIGRQYSITERSNKLRSLSNYIAGISEKDSRKRENLANWLYEIPVHESGLLQHRRQLIKRNGKLIEAGPAMSQFGIELPTAKDLIDFSFRQKKPELRDLLTNMSGLEAKKLKKLTQKELADLLMTNDKFAASIAVAKSRWINRVYGADIPGSMEGRAQYSARYYNAGAHQDRYRERYIRDNRLISQEIKAEYTGKAMQKHTMTPPKTHGLVNDVLHNNKIKHNISSQSKSLGPIRNALKGVSKIKSRR